MKQGMFKVCLLPLSPAILGHRASPPLLASQLKLLVRDGIVVSPSPPILKITVIAS